LFDQMFIGVCGLDLQAGLTAVYYEDACFKKEVMRQSNEVIAAVIADKPQVARYKVASCEDLDVVVASSQTDTGSLAHTNIRLEIAPICTQSWEGVGLPFHSRQIVVQAGG
jgi:DeoR/GlpR family transcriptional regulator of sugar metabolism